MQEKIYENKEDAKKAIIENIKNGKEFEKFKELVKDQSGYIEYINHPEKFQIKIIDALTIGLGSCHLGGGREKITDTIDMSAGIYLNY